VVLPVIVVAGLAAAWTSAFRHGLHRAAVPGGGHQPEGREGPAAEQQRRVGLYTAGEVARLSDPVCRYVAGPRARADVWLGGPAVYPGGGAEAGAGGGAARASPPVWLVNCSVPGTRDYGSAAWDAHTGALLSASFMRIRERGRPERSDAAPARLSAPDWLWRLRLGDRGDPSAGRAPARADWRQVGGDERRGRRRGSRWRAGGKEARVEFDAATGEFRTARLTRRP
jgi:hypothetical protein